MQDHGYETEFSVGVTAASATLGPIIPPSLPFVIYGMMANVSIGALFMGGFIPGAVMTIFMMLYVTYSIMKIVMMAPGMKPPMNRAPIETLAIMP